MADVWLARDEMLNRPVAVKFLHERFAQDAQFVERFRREAEAAAGLQHANVVGVFDRGVADGRHWIAMEYVEGAALKDLIARGLSVGEAVEIIRQVLSGARFAHARASSTATSSRRTCSSTARARAGDRLRNRARRRLRDHRHGLCARHRPVPVARAGAGPRRDRDVRHLLGRVMLYEALTGSVPFDADTPVAVALKQVSEQPGPLAAQSAGDPGARCGRAARARQGPREPVPVGGRVHAGARRGRADPSGARSATPPHTRPLPPGPSPARRRGTAMGADRAAAAGAPDGAIAPSEAREAVGSPGAELRCWRPSR